MFVEDLSVFINPDTPGYVLAKVDGVDVGMLFDRAYTGALSGLVESTGPQAVAKSADVAAVVQGSALVIGGVTYTVTGVEPDGTGITTLQLRM